MFAKLNADTFRINTFVPALQTAAVIGVNEALGSLGKYSVTMQTAALIGGVASITTAVAQNLFDNSFVRYLSTGLGVLAGLAAHRFFYPALPAIDPVGALIIGSVILTVRFAANQIRTREVIVEDTVTV